MRVTLDPNPLKNAAEFSQQLESEGRNYFHYGNGRVEKLIVKPARRRADLVNCWIGRDE